jgi:hypothetical protein
MSIKLPNFNLNGDLEPCQENIINFINENFEIIDFTKSYSVQRVSDLPLTATTGDKVILDSNNNVYYWTDSWQEVSSKSGMVAYDETNSELIFFDGTAWNGITITGFEPFLGNPTSDGQVLSSTTSGVRSWIDISAETGQIRSLVFNNIASDQTVFDLTLGGINPVDAIGKNYIWVHVGGVYQEKESYFYSTVTKQVTLDTPAPAGTNVEFVWIENIADIGVPGDDTVSTAKIQDGAVTPDKVSKYKGTYTITATGVTVPDNTPTKVNFDTAKPYSNMSFNSSLNRVTITRPGLYRVTANMLHENGTWGSTVGLYANAELYINGIRAILGPRICYRNYTGNASSPLDSGIIELAANDYIEIFARHNKGSNSTISNTPEFTNFSIEEVL